jgi:NAD-dependent SIR2 family protein deacetylase
MQCGGDKNDALIDTNIKKKKTKQKIMKPSLMLPKVLLQADEDPGQGNFFMVKSAVRSDSQTFESEALRHDVSSASELLRSARSVLVVAGAGMGVDSGLPDYRSADGFWHDYPQFARLGLKLDEMANAEWFSRDEMAAWGFYAHRQRLYAEAVPHRGFEVLRALLGHWQRGDYWVFTSNIDSQFQKAGFDVDRICECHGSLSWLQCSNNECVRRCWYQVVHADVDERTMRCSDAAQLPRCPRCNSVARPNVSMFGDTEDTFVQKRYWEQKSRLLRWLRRQRDINDKSGTYTAVVELGCGMSIHSIRVESEALCTRRPDIRMLRVNPTDFAVPSGRWPPDDPNTSKALVKRQLSAFSLSSLSSSSPSSSSSLSIVSDSDCVDDDDLRAPRHVGLSFGALKSLTLIGELIDPLEHPIVRLDTSEHDSDVANGDESDAQNDGDSERPRKRRRRRASSAIEERRKADALMAEQIAGAAADVVDSDSVQICCELCDTWYRCAALGLSASEAEALDAWYCQQCLSESVF